MKPIFKRVLSVCLFLLAMGNLSAQQNPRDLSGQARVTTANEVSHLDRATGEIISKIDLTLTNAGPSPIRGPLHAVIEFEGQGDLERITVRGALGGRGQAPYQAYYLDLGTALGQELGTGADLPFQLEFSRPPTLQALFKVTVFGVANRPPLAAMAEVPPAIVGQPVAFDASASGDPDGDALSGDWDFGDENTGSGLLANHAYDSPGVYDIVVTIRDPDGLEDTLSRSLLVLPEGAFALARTRVLDHSGVPLAGVRIDAFQDGIEAGSYFADDDGYAVLGGEPGSFWWRFSKPGHVPVWREAELEDGRVSLVPSPWLAVVAPAATEVSPLEAASISSAALDLLAAFPAGAISQPGQAGLTALNSQALPLPLPAGWSPLAALSLEGPGEILTPGTLALSQSPPVAATVCLLRLDPENPAWIVESVGLDFVLPDYGIFAVVAADAPPTEPPVPVPGEALAGFAAADFPPVTATGETTPPSRTASLDPALVTTTGKVTFTAESPLPSGRFFRTRVDERYALRGGGTLRPPEYDTTFFAYQRPGAPDPATLHAVFPLRPTRLLGPAELDAAEITVDVLEPSEFLAAVLGGEGGALSAGEIRLTLPPGRLSAGTAVELRQLDPAGFANALHGLSPFLAFQLGFSPREAAELLAAFTGLPPESDFVLGRVIATADGEGLQPVLRMRTGADGTARSVEPETPPRLPGITSGGTFVLVGVDGPQGLVRGTVTALDGQARAGLLASVDASPWRAVTTAGGTFSLLAAQGPGSASATDPADGNRGAAAFSMDDPAAGVVVEIALVATGPSVVSISPADGATKVRPVTPIVVHFSEPIDPASFGPEALTVTNPLGVVVAGSLGLNQARTTATFLPTNPLEHAATFTVELAPTIRDPQGQEIEGALTFTFSVLPFFERPPGAQLVIYEPGAGEVPAEVRAQLVGYSSEPGSSHVVAHGTPGTADPGVAVILVNLMTGMTATVLSRPDGSFANYLDAVPEDFVEAVFVNANGTRVTVPATRQLFDDGRVGLYKYGGILEAESDGGPVQVLIEPRAIPERSVFRLQTVSVNQLKELTGGVLPDGENTALPGLQIDVEGDMPVGDAEVSMPLDPATLGLDPDVIAEELPFVMTMPIEVAGEVVYVTLDRMRYEDGRLFTNTCPFKGVYSSTIQDNLIDFGANFLPVGLGAGLVFSAGRMLVPVLLSKTKGGGGFTINGTVAQLPVSSVELIDGARIRSLALLPLRFIPSRMLSTLDLIGNPGDATEEALLSRAVPVQGALVALRSQNENFDGKIRAGAVCAVSDEFGCYSLMAPGFVSQKLVATHPRLGRARDVNLGALDFLDIGFKAFVARNIFFGVPDEIALNQRPRLVARHQPLSPALGEAVTLQVDAFATARRPLTIKLEDEIQVATAVLGQAVSTGDLQLGSQEVEEIAPGHKRLTVEITAGKSLHASFLIKAVTTGRDGQEIPAPMTYTISFGFARPPVANGLAPSNPNDNEAPYVVNFEPRNGQFLFPGQPIHVRFNEPLDRGFLDVPGAVAFEHGGEAPVLRLSGDQQTLTVFPRDLPSGGTVTLTLGTAIEDLAGNAMETSVQATWDLGPYPVHRLRNIDRGGGSVLAGNMLYVLERGARAGLKVFDVSDPTMPVSIGALEASGQPSALDFPRDIALIENWSHIPGLEGSAELPATTRTLLAVVGGLVGSVAVDDLGNPLLSGQYLTVVDADRPGNPQIVANVQLTLRPSVVQKVLWEPPNLYYLENSADTHFVVAVDLQELLIGFSVPSWERSTVFKDGKEGRDLNGDGDYTDPGEQRPWPKISDVTEFMGFRAGFDLLPRPRQRIEDFDMRGGALAAVRSLSGLSPPVPGTARPEFRLIIANGQELPHEAGVMAFETNERPRRVALAPLVEAGGELKNLAFVSLSAGADGVAKLVVIDWTDVFEPVRVRDIEFPASLGLGALSGITLRPDGLLALSGATKVILIDPAAALLDSTVDGLHSSVLAILPSGGSGNFSIGENNAGLRSVALGGRNELSMAPPTLSFVHFPSADEAIDPLDLQGDVAKREETLAAMRRAASLRPARHKALAGVASSLSPPSPLAHYHVLVSAPGGAGVTIPLLVESLNESGAPLRNLGKDYPAVRAALSDFTIALALRPNPEVDAPLAPLTAYRLSDDPTEEAYNLYLSDAIVLVREKMTSGDIVELMEEHPRVILWSEAMLRAGFDAGASGVLGPYAASLEVLRGEYRPVVSVTASTLPGGYVPGSTPPPVGGSLAVPGTFGTIDAANGEFRHTTADLELPSRRMPIVFERTATSHALVSSGFGRGWDFNYNQRAIELKPDLVPPGQREPVTDRGDEERDVVATTFDIILSDGAGNAILFEHKGDTAPKGVDNDPLVGELGWLSGGGDFYMPADTQKGVFDLIYRFPSGEMVRLTPAGTQFRYRSDGRLVKIEDRYPKNHHVLDYNQDGDLVRIRDLSVSEDRFIRIGYFRKGADGPTFDSVVDKVAESGSESHIGKICSLLDSADRRIDFEYDDAGMLFERHGIEVDGDNNGFSGRPKTTYQIDSRTRAYVGVIAGSGAHGGGGAAGTPLAVATTAANVLKEAVANATAGAGGPVKITIPDERSAANINQGDTDSEHADESKTAISYDENGYPLSIRMSGPRADNAGFETIHNALGLLETIIHPEGNSISYEYEDATTAPFRARANIVKETRDPGVRGGAILVSELAYDHNYNLPSGRQKDFNGNSFDIILSDKRDVQKIDYPKATPHEFDYNDFGQLVSETTVGGITTAFEYDNNHGYVTKRTLGGNLVTNFAYDNSVAAKLGMATTITPPRGASISMVYDARLQRTEMKRGDQEEKTGYDENGNVVFISRVLGDGADYKEEREYSQINFLKKLTVRGVETGDDTDDLITTLTPDPLFRVKEMTLPGGEVRKFEYDHLGNVTLMEIGNYKETYGRDLHGNVTRIEKGDEIVQETIYDGHDRPEVIKNKTAADEEETTTLTYFDGGELKSRVVTGTVGGEVLNFEVSNVDELGRPLANKMTGDQANAEITIDYTRDDGRSVRRTGPVDTTTSTHDAAGRPITQTDSLRSLTFTPDANGNIERVDFNEDGETYRIDMEYNDLDHLTKRHDPVGTILEATALRHDGSPLTVKDGRGNSITQTYSRLGELLRLDRPEQLRFAYAFDANRQPVAVRDRTGAGNENAFDDGTLRPTVTTWRDGSTTEFNEPDGRNLPTSIVLPGGSITATYDRQGRPTTFNTTYAGGNYRLDNVKYDALGRLRSADYGSSGQFSLTMDFDRLGPLVACTHSEVGGDYTVKATIRADGVRTGLTYPSDVTVTESREDSGRLTRVSVNGSPVWEATTFAGADLPATIKRGRVITETCEYDARRRLLSRRFTDPGGLVLEDMRFKYDLANNITVRQSMIGGGRADIFEYDNADRLTQAEYGTRPRFFGAKRDGADGLTGGEGFAEGWYAREHSYDLGGLDLLLGGALANPDALPGQTSTGTSAIAVPHFAASLAGHDSFLFAATVDGFSRGRPDPLGNTARAQLLVRPATGPPRLVPANLTYNAHSNLIRVEREDGLSIDYQYRPDKLLHHRRVSGGPNGVEHSLVWHEGRLLEEYDVSAGRLLIARYYYANDDPPVAADLLQQDGTFLRVHYFWDQALSVVAVADDQGRILERARYDAWGQAVITERDEAPPRIAQVRLDGDDLLVIMSEPVLPPLRAQAGSNTQPVNANTPGDAFRLFVGSNQQSLQVVFEENLAGLPFGSVFRLTPSGSLTGEITVRTVAGGLVDGWNNPVGDEDLTFVFGPGPVLANGGAAIGATAPAAINRSGIGNPWLWQGQYFDYDAGLTYMRARHYDPVSGQFLQRDPMQYADSVNLYAGMGNNVVSLRDPSGRNVARAADLLDANAVRAIMRKALNRGAKLDTKVKLGEVEMSMERTSDVLNILKKNDQLHFVGMGSAGVIFGVKKTNYAIKTFLGDHLTNEAIKTVRGRFDDEVRGFTLYSRIGWMRFHGGDASGRVVLRRQDGILSIDIGRPAFVTDMQHGLLDSDSVRGLVDPVGKVSSKQLDALLNQHIIGGEGFLKKLGIRPRDIELQGGLVRNPNGSFSPRFNDPPPLSEIQFNRAVQKLDDLRSSGLRQQDIPGSMYNP